MKIKVYGTGCCSSCENLYNAAAKAVSELGIDADISKETDIEVIIAKNLMNLPALEINDIVVSQGRKLSADDVKKILTAQK